MSQSEKHARIDYNYALHFNIMYIIHPIWEVSVSYVSFSSLNGSWGPTCLTAVYAKIPDPGMFTENRLCRCDTMPQYFVRSDV